MKNILITGANGFIGRALVSVLAYKKDHRLLLALRKKNAEFLNAPQLQVIFVGDIGPDTVWSPHLKGVNTVIHTAARVHQMQESHLDPLTEYLRTNVEGTLALAKQAAEMGVRRFIFLSTIKVNGESTSLNNPFTAQDIPAPKNPYSISKYQAEIGLQQISKKTGLEVVIIRPPLMYGPRVGGNFLSLLHLVHRGIPLPLKTIQNKRSFLSVNNLVHFIAHCLDYPLPLSDVFLLSDQNDLSTSELIEKIAMAMKKKSTLFPFPQQILKIASQVVFKKTIYDRLCHSLQIDSEKATKILGWKPPYSIDHEMKETVEWYKNLHK